MRRIAMGLALTALAGVAHAEVTDKSAAGFEVTEKVSIAASPDKVWGALLRPAKWWAGDHTYSGDSKNLSFDPSGCFCEILKDGAVRHMTIVYSDKAKAMRLEGALGPLQMTGATGHLGFTLKPAGAGTALTVTYDVGGYAKGGLAETYAGPVDKVLGEQVARLKRVAEGGKAE
jgi:uncharacterized protein YndB with AHSA1/START domain